MFRLAFMLSLTAIDYFFFSDVHNWNILIYGKEGETRIKLYAEG